MKETYKLDAKDSGIQVPESFINILRLSQDKLKSFLKFELENAGYDSIAAEDGFLYAKGTAPILLVAHLDTVHKNLPYEIKIRNGVISSPSGIGGDDRCGVHIICNLLKMKPSVLFCEDEEIGGKGANKFASTDYIKNLGVKLIVEFDRRGNNDAVFYNCDSPEFEKFVQETTGYTKNYGTFSDISIIAPRSGIAAVNLSSGYYSEHTPTEIIKYGEVLKAVEAGKKLIEATEKLENQFEYVARKYYQPSFFSGEYGGSGSRKSTFTDLNVSVSVYFECRDTGEYEVGSGFGKTKGDAWYNFFKEYSYVCFDDIIDFEYE